MDVRFLAPWFLLLLLALPALWWWPRRWDDLRHAVIRTVLLAFVVLALARPVAFTTDRGEFQVLVVDRSASVAEDARRLLDAAADRVIERLPGRARPVLVEIGPAADAPSRARRIAIPNASSLSSALAAAGRAIPEGARGAITLLTDGHGTDQRWGPVAQTLTARGIPVHAVRVDAVAGDVRPVAMRPERTLRVGQTARVTVDIAGRGAVVAVRLFGPDGELARRDDVAVEGRATTVLEFEPAVAGFVSLTVAVDVVRGSDAIGHDNRMSRTVAVQEPFRVLYLGERVTGSAAAVGDLLGPGFRLEAQATWSADDAGPELSRYDAVFLDDRPARAVPVPFQRDLVEAVTDDGLGLLFAGGRAAYGPGGFYGTPVADVLPVESMQKEEKRDPSTTLVVIIDTSGSMGGMRVTLAKEVARLAMRRLLPHDKVGIVEFYGAKRWAAPIQPASNLIELRRALNRLDAGGGTVILPAIEEAFYGLQNVETRYKHVLILTDGGVETGAFEPLLRKMAAKGINVSTVLVGPDAHSEFLVTLANWGKGRFYSVPNRFNLPEIMLKQPASAPLPAYRPGKRAVRGRGGSGWWGAVDRASVPPVSGLVETAIRPGAETVLETADGVQPVVASWRFGLGRVTAMATEPTGPGTETWRDWSDFGAFLARVLTRTARERRAEFDYRLTRDDDRITLTAERLVRGDGRPRARILDGGDAQSAEIGFRERADGRFTALWTWDPALELRALAGAQGQIRLVSPARADVAAEHQVDPNVALDLAALARATGGASLDVATVGAADLTVGGGEEPLTVLELRPWFLLVALLAYLVDLLYRRWPQPAGAVRSES